MKFFPACILAALLWMRALAGNAQSFGNGSFELTNGRTVPNGGSLTLLPGDTWLTGWSAGGPGGTVMVQNGSAGFEDGSAFGLNPYDGQQWVMFPDDTAGGSVSQTFSTTPGSYIAVVFFSGTVYESDDAMLAANATTSGGTVLTNEFVAPGFGYWTSNQFSFIAQSATTTLTFTDQTPDPDGADLGLDAIKVVQEPPGWPYVITNPASLTNSAGTVAVFTTAAGGNPSSVQWFLNSIAVAGATNLTLTIVADVTNAGSYMAEFSNNIGTNFSAVATLTVLQVSNAPVNQTASPGQTVVFVAASDISQATVQWFFEGSAIIGATQTSLILTANSQTAGSYTAQFIYGSVTNTSAPAILTVLNIPFQNGSFENANPPLASGGYEGGNPGDTWLTGWNFGTTNAVFVFNGPEFGLNPVDGNQWIVFDSEDSPPPGRLFQTFTTVPGRPYLVTFFAVDVYYNLDGESGLVRSLSAQAGNPDGSVIGQLTIQPQPNWTAYQFGFVAQKNNTVLSFLDESDPLVGPSVGLDDVTTGAIPTELQAVSFSSASSTFVFQLNGQAGQSFIVQMSADLKSWQTVSTNVLTAASVYLTNGVPSGATQEFWRALPGP